jgi:hypothetical protein
MSLSKSTIEEIRNDIENGDYAYVHRDSVQSLCDMALESLEKEESYGVCPTCATEVTIKDFKSVHQSKIKRIEDLTAKLAEANRVIELVYDNFPCKSVENYLNKYKGSK